MSLFEKAVAMAVLALALIAPVSASVDCDGDHQQGEHAACVCVCCGESTIEYDHLSTCLTPPAGARVHATEITSVGTLLPADIFRPPATA